MKTLKTETEKELTIQRRHHARHYTLTVDKNLCVGCELCALICPREAIEIKTKPKTTENEKAQKPAIHIDETKCHYCGICNAICPYGAITVKINNEPFITVVDKESFPQLIRDIKVDATKCDIGCIDCQDACPLNLITVTVQTPEGKTIQPKAAEAIPNKKGLKVQVEIKKEYCPACRICEVKCPKHAIRVRKIFYGTLKINREKCPEGCRDCLDVCPITGALYVLEEDNKVYVNELFCVYCGVCKLVCPEEGALELQRTSILHTQVRSGAWNKALEKLTSTIEMTKELRAKGLSKARESVEKLLAWRKT